MPKQEHYIDVIAGKIQHDLQTWPDELADMIRGGQRAPLAAAIDEHQKLDYYKRQFFNPDGSENQEGRTQVMNRVGIAGYAAIVDALNEGNSREDVR